MDKKPKYDKAYSGLDRWSFRKIAPNGFGDAYNAYPHSMAWFNDHLYVGTTRANLASRAKQIASNTPEKMGKVWPVRIPNSTFDNPLRAEIWRYNPPANKWSKVYTSPMVKGIDGFDVPISVGFRCMTSFQGPGDSTPALYVPTWASHQTPATVMLKSIDGINFEKVSEPGLGISENTPRSLRGIVGFKGRLFTSPVVGQNRREPNIAGSAIVYVSSDPDHGAWKVACEPSFGDPNNLSVFHMAASEKYFYAGTLNVYDGFQVWKTDAEGEPPFKWKKIITNGAYRGKLNQIAMTLIHFNGHIYVGGAIQNCSWDFDYNVGPGAPEVIRINPDDSWDLVVGEPRITPDGLKAPLSGLGPGFRDPFAGYIWSMCVHEGWLYVANAVWAIFLRYSDRIDRLPKILRAMYDPEYLENILKDFGGCDLWRTRDGYNWKPVTLNGFDNCYNIGFRNMVSSPYGLFVGAANPFTPEVAVRRFAGWNYEKNPRGGIEMWFGSHKHGAPAKSLDHPETTPAFLTKSQATRHKRDESDEETLEKLINKFYGGSNFRHFGIWKVGIDDARTACENLMDEILAFIPEKKGSVIDIGCNLGSSTQHLLKHFPPQVVTGITADRKSLEACQKKIPQVTFLCRKLPKLKLHDESFDIVMWFKGFNRLGSRKKLLREAFRLLKPGGRLVCFDVLYAAKTRNSLWEKIGGLENPVRTMDDYRNLLHTEGFQYLKLIDVTAESFNGFQMHVERYFALRRISGDIDKNMHRKIKTYFQLDEPTVNKCLLVSCCKPEGVRQAA